jgi:hypothetical protein
LLLALSDTGGVSNNMNPVVQFKVGGVYECRSVCDSGCRWTFAVVRRTDSTVWIREGEAGEVKARRVSVYDGREQVFPSGKYSMAPILNATSGVAVPK